MWKFVSGFAARFFVALLILAGGARSVRVFPAPADHEPSSPSIICRTLEVHATPQSANGLGVLLVIFHQRDEQNREELSEFLRAHPESAVQFQSADGTWRDATVFRLKSCFGRGLLVFSAGRATLAANDTFTLRLASPK